MKRNEELAKALAEAIIGASLGTKQEVKDVRKESAELAKPIFETYLGIMDVGFTEKQAFEILIKAL